MTMSTADTTTEAFANARPGSAEDQKALFLRRVASSATEPVADMKVL